MDEEIFAEFNFAAEEPVFVISVVSRLVQIPIWTLRVLDKKGVVSPKKTQGKTRLYCLKDLKRLAKIRELMEERGVNLNGIKMILELMEKM